MTTWILSICMGISAWGCGSVATPEYPSEEACYRALAAMKTGDQPVAESNTKRNTVAYCRPKKEVTK